MRRRAGYRAGSGASGLAGRRVLAVTHAHGLAEHWIVSTLLLAGLCYLLWRETGLAGFVHHLRAAPASAP